MSHCRYGAIIVVSLAIQVSCNAEEQRPSFIDSHMQRLEQSESNGLYRLVDRCPTNFEQNIRIPLTNRVTTVAEHRATVESLPLAAWRGLRIGETKEYDEWIMTSLDPATAGTTRSQWIAIIATRRNGKEALVQSAW